VLANLLVRLPEVLIAASKRRGMRRAGSSDSRRARSSDAGMVAGDQVLMAGVWGKF
jgi:hypothetical protein